MINKDEVVFGVIVCVMDFDFDDEEMIIFVGVGEEDYDKGYFLIISLIGCGLVGKKVGDIVDIEVFKGSIWFEILEIKYD